MSKHKTASKIETKYDLDKIFDLWRNYLNSF